MVVILRGPSSVGKTTTSYALAEAMPASAYLQGDGFPWMSDQTMQSLRKRSKEEGYHFLNAWLAAGIAVVLEHGFHAVVDWAFTKDAELRDLLARIDHLSHMVHVFNLVVDPEEQLKRDAKRPPDERIGKEGVEHFQTADESARSNMGISIDTTDLSPQEVAERILDQTKGTGQQTGRGDAENPAPHP